MSLILFFLLIGYDRSSDTLIGEDLQQQAVCQTSIQNMHTVYTVADRRSTVVQLRQHTTADVTIVDQSLCLGSCQSGNKCGLVIDVLVQSLDIRQKCQFLRMYCFCDSAGRIIRIDIVGVIILDRKSVV